MNMKENIDNISIDLMVQAGQLGKDDIWMQGDLEIQINGKKPYGDSDIIDVSVFFESLKLDGEYFIFTCNCGIPECSGWIKGIKVIHKENNIVWSNENTNDTWIFDKSKIEKNLSEIRTEVMNYKDFFSEKGILYVGVGYDW